MADERLLSVDEFLLKLIVTVMHGRPAMTAAQIAKAASMKTARKVDRSIVEATLGPLGGALVTVSGLPRCHITRQRGRGILRRNTRWRLVEAPASAPPPDATGAPVPARPRPPTLSGAAAADLNFRDDEPPAAAIGRLA